MYNKKGNLAFMATVALAALFSLSAIALFGLSTLSLAILFVNTLGSVLLGKWLEELIEKREEDAFYARFENDENEIL